MGGSDKLMPVAQKSANQLGLYDMSGNVWEWCFTVNGLFRVSRGGNWRDSAVFMRVGFWSSYDPTFKCYDLGFRFARTQ